jgi:acetoin utilization deacetylase AcuC-like enzyme
MTTGFVWHERYMWHDTGKATGVLAPGGYLEPYEHVENPDAKRRIRNLLDACGLLDRLTAVKPREATRPELGRVHTMEYIERIAELSQDPPRADVGYGTAIGNGSFEIASLAAGGVMAAVDAVLDGTVDNAYALVRPCGHHALADTAVGSAIFNSVAVAARHAQSRGLDRIAIVDWDVHFGNGTQAMFYDDASVLNISIHQDEWMGLPDGTTDKRGEGAGEGYTVNVPLPAGSGQAAYLATLDRVVIPALERFRPDLIIIATGFDANGFDPLARMTLTSDSFRTMTQKIKDTAERLCGGRLVAAHEGGYSPWYVPFCALGLVEALSGIRTDVVDPFLPFLVPHKDSLLPHQEAVIAAAEAGLPDPTEPTPTS